MSGRPWVMTPEEQAIALQEAKARGLPDGWRVELDVRTTVVLSNGGKCCYKTRVSHTFSISWFLPIKET
jgi:hypothetical protein